MPQPLEICLEELSSSDDDRFVRCVALPGGQPGLALDRCGSVRWMPDEPAPYGLWISADDRLMLLRAADAAPIVVRRGGRALEAPVGKPVVLRDGDLLVVDGRELRVHVHGLALEVHAPERLSASSLVRMARAAAAAVALSAAIALPAQSAQAMPVVAPPPIEVQPHPPAPPAMRQVVCPVTRMVPRKGLPMEVHATCPANHRLWVGTSGSIGDAKNAQQSTVVIRQVKGNDVVCESPLKAPIKGAKITFYAHY